MSDISLPIINIHGSVLTSTSPVACDRLVECSTMIAVAQDAAMTDDELQLSKFLLGPWVRDIPIKNAIIDEVLLITANWFPN